MPVTAPGRWTDADARSVLEDALADLLAAVTAYDAHQAGALPPPRPSWPGSTLLSAADVVARLPRTPRDRLLDALASHPIRYALVQAIRRIGDELFRLGGVALMEDVAERLADRPLVCDPDGSFAANPPRILGLLDHLWDGIGSWQA